MPNINSLLNEQIRRLARREIKSQTKITRRLTAQYRRDIAALKRQVASLSKTVKFLEAQEKKRVGQQPSPAELEDVRFRADGLRTHRSKLGISAADYGKLVGVSGLSIYHWESGKAKPRRQQLAKLVGVRGIGKREAFKRLQILDGSNGEAAPSARRRLGGPTAEEFVLALVKGKKATTSREINDAWKRDGRPGKADNTLSIMVRGGQLRRTKLKGERGSRYAAGR